MKIAIIGYSACGKSTLARKLSETHNVDVLHLDTIQFLPNWVIRDEEDKVRMIKEFLDTHDSWIIDGNYSSLCQERRLEEADLIILLLFNRFSCLLRAYSRYKKYKNKTRPDMAQGCNEKIDLEFVKWILYKGRTKQKRQKYSNIVAKYSDKAILIKNQKQLNTYINALNKKAYKPN